VGGGFRVLASCNSNSNYNLTAGLIREQLEEQYPTSTNRALMENRQSSDGSRLPYFSNQALHCSLGQRPPAEPKTKAVGRIVGKRGEGKQAARSRGEVQRELAEIDQIVKQIAQMKTPDSFK
jgi:hypothetical protein